MNELLPFLKLMEEVKRWSLRNFGNKQDPFLGLIEELGELARCRLKRMQRIRGFEDEKYFLEQYTDAIGDIGVYAANYAFMRNLQVNWPIPRTVRLSNEHFTEACYWLAMMEMGLPEHSQRGSSFNSFLGQIDCLARLEGTTLEWATNQVWSKVRQRDWINNQIDGQI